MFRGGPTHPGVAATRGLERLGGLAWRFQTDGPVRSSPTLADGVVYFGSTDGRLYAVDAASGAERWRYEAGAPIGGAPLVTEGSVIAIDRANRIHAVQRSTGEPLWQVATGRDVPLVWGREGWDYLLAAPMPAGDLVLAGSGDGHLYALGLQRGDIRWRFPTGGRIRSAPAIHDDVAYVSSGDGIVYGVSLDDGSEVWRFETAGHALEAADWGFDRTQIYSSPTIVDGVLYIGSRDASLYAIDIATGQARWTSEDGTAWVIATPAVAADRVLSARSSSGKVRAVDRDDGTELWSVATGGMVFSSPVVVGETVYIGSADERIYAFDLATGEGRWTYRTGGGVFSSPVVWEGRLYVGSDDGYLYALAGTDGPQPRLAVYWDDALMGRAIWGGRDTHKRVAEHFQELGYEPLDSAGLESFLTERLKDAVPSVVMVAMDALPATVAAPDQEAPLLRRYLERGGKIVWMGFPPLVVVRDDAGQITGVDRDRPAQLLGVDHDAWDRGGPRLGPRVGLGRLAGRRGRSAADRAGR
jgi:outer membrane protein assembly factor BamB